MAVTEEAKVSFQAFLLGVSIISLSLLNYISYSAAEWVDTFLYRWLLVYTAFVYALIFAVETGHHLQVAVRSAGLGIVFGLGLMVGNCGVPSWIPFGWYMCVLSFFHVSEYITTAIINPSALNLESFLINHSKEYGFAAMCSWVEFFVERYFFPQLKTIYFISLLGLLLCLAGEFIRKLAMLTAMSNFTHLIRFRRVQGHRLVTTGIYGLWRHPSYVGWFWWSIGTQLLLVNPVCVIGYTLASWRFFNERIVEEEITLLHFFGEEYYNYQKQVPTGLPFITGFQVNT